MVMVVTMGMVIFCCFVSSIIFKTRSLFEFLFQEKRKQHNCPFCDRAFTRPYRLNDHISFSHTDEVKSICYNGY